MAGDIRSLLRPYLIPHNNYNGNKRLVFTRSSRFHNHDTLNTAKKKKKKKKMEKEREHINNQQETTA